MRVSHKKAIIISGLSWCAIGLFLLYKGLFLLNGISIEQPPALVQFFMRFVKNAEQAVLFLVIFGLLGGFIKARVVLNKTADRVINRIKSQSEPLPLWKFYNKSYLLLMVCMMLLGMSIRFLPIGADFRGFIDVAIGSALMNAGMGFIRKATYRPRNEISKS